MNLSTFKKQNVWMNYIFKWIKLKFNSINTEMFIRKMHWDALQLNCSCCAGKMNKIFNKVKDFLKDLFTGCKKSKPSNEVKTTASPSNEAKHENEEKCDDEEESIQTTTQSIQTSNSKEFKETTIGSKLIPIKVILFTMIFKSFNLKKWKKKFYLSLGFGSIDKNLSNRFFFNGFKWRKSYYY